MAETENAIADNLVKDLSQGERPKQTSLSNPRVVIRVLATDLGLPVRTMTEPVQERRRRQTEDSAVDFASVRFSGELSSEYRSWKCSAKKTCSGVRLKMMNYKTKSIQAARVWDLDFLKNKVQKICNFLSILVGAPDPSSFVMMIRPSQWPIKLPEVPIHLQAGIH